MAILSTRVTACSSELFNIENIIDENIYYGYDPETGEKSTAEQRKAAWNEFAQQNRNKNKSPVNSEVSVALITQALYGRSPLNEPPNRILDLSKANPRQLQYSPNNEWEWDDENNENNNENNANNAENADNANNDNGENNNHRDENIDDEENNAMWLDTPVKTAVPPPKDIKATPPPLKTLPQVQDQLEEQIIDIPQNQPENQIMGDQQQFNVMDANQFNQILNHITQNFANIRSEQNIRPYDVTFIEGKTNPRKFLVEIKSRIDANGVPTQRRRLQILWSILPPTASLWLRTEVDAGRIDNWDSQNAQNTALVPKFIQRYLTPPLKRKLLEEYNNLKLSQKESIEDYYRKLQDYWRDLQNQPDAYGQKEKFIQGPPSIVV
jgi:hypothetical protein